MRRVQNVATALLVVVTGIAWTQILNLQWNAGLLVVPAVIIGSGAFVFVHKPWAGIVVRAALWGSLLCGAVVAAHPVHDEPGLLVAWPAGFGLLCLGRFARSVGRARPLLVALVVLGVSDVVTHGSVALFIAFGSGTREGVLVLFAFAALANIVGLLAIVRWRLIWPHVLANAAILVAAVCHVVDVKPLILGVMGAAASAQIVLALLQLLPRASPRTRRISEWCMRVALVAGLLTLTWASWARAFD